jgi:hypothetical protein
MHRLFATAILAALPLVGSLGCSGSGLMAMGAAGDDAADTDSGTDTDAADAPDRKGAVAATLPPEPCDAETPAAFAVTPPDADDAVSPVLARLLLENGRSPAIPIRVHEFLNYYQADAEPAAVGQLRVEAAAADRGGGAFALDLAATAADAIPDRALNLVLAVDTSESMGGTRIARARQCCVALAGALRAGDAVAIAPLDGGPPQLPSTTVSGPGDEELIAHCNAIAATAAAGAGDPTAGLDAAYGLVDQRRDGTRLNRVIVLTSGELTVSADAVAIAAVGATGGPLEQVVLVGVGVADPAVAEPYDRAALDALTAAGAGPHRLVDSADEAAATFGARLPTLVGVAAVAPAFEIVLPPTLALAALDGVPLAALDGAGGADRLAPGQAIAIRLDAVSCDPAALDPAQPLRIAATALDPETAAPFGGVLETTLAQLLAASVAPGKRAAVIAYAGALAAWSEAAPDSAREAALAALATAAAAAEARPDDPDLAEIRSLLEAYLALL